mgnify:CR=1 FL=1
MDENLLDLEDTETAYQARSDSELKHTFRLFKTLNNNFINQLGILTARLAYSMHLPLDFIMKRTLYGQFCGGESLNECSAVVAKLHTYGVKVCLDYAVEGEHSELGYEQTSNELMRMIEFSSSRDEIPFVVFKPTGIASAQLLEAISRGQNLTESQILQWKGSKERFSKICAASYKAGKRLFIDAEESWLQPAIDDMSEEMMKRFNVDWPCIHNTLQFYRHDRLEFLERSLIRAREEGYSFGVKLVRGAYMDREKERARTLGYEDPIQPNKQSTDHDYDKALKLCVDNLNHVSLCAASHNEKSSLFLVKLMKDRGIERHHSNIYFSQLYGMGDHLSFNLAKSGFNVCKYLPYGPVGSVMPYLMRRAEENTSIGDQMSRDLRLLKMEIGRRRL